MLVRFMPDYIIALADDSEVKIDRTTAKKWHLVATEIAKSQKKLTTPEQEDYYFRALWELINLGREHQYGADPAPRKYVW